jgi:hypothetical protein
MAWTSWQTFPTISSQTRTGSAVSWTNPSNAASSDNTYATATVTSNITHWLWCTGADFSEVPSGATITGVKIRFERKQNNLIDGGISTTYVQLIKGGALTGTEQTQSISWPAGDGVSSEIGGTGNLLGATFTEAEAIASDTGVAIAARDDAGFGTTGSIDVVEMAFEYTVPDTRRRVYSSMM